MPERAFLPPAVSLRAVEADEIERAVRVLRSGGLVAFPTETVYGLGADAGDEAAVSRIFAAKGRPPGHPLIVHLSSDKRLNEWTVDVPDTARLLARRFWPGPLTLILRRSPRVADAVTGGRPTVGIRVPDHPVALELLDAFGGGIAAPSANRFGSVSPTTAEHVRLELGDAVDVVLDGGPCRVGVESTILDLTGDEPAILRPGGLTREELQEALGRPVPERAAGGPAAPGRLPSHYAPRARVVVVPPEQVLDAARRELEAGRRVGVLVASRPTGLPDGVDLLQLPDDPHERARNLYACLREADRRGLDILVTSAPSEEGLGHAVADRLRKAAGPRDGNDDTPEGP